MNSVGIFLATTGDGIARAADGGDDEWSVEHVLEGEDVQCLAADPLTSGVVYAETDRRGVLRSDDYGTTWHTVGLMDENVKSLAVSRLEKDNIYAGTRPAKVYASEDAGGTWRELEGFRRIRSRRFWFSPADWPFTAYV
jgi:hypothetical protein